MRPSTEDSLRKLQTEYVDLLLIHWPSDRVDPAATLEQMQVMADEGKVRHLGVSNYPPSWLRRAQETAEIFCNQVEYHPYLSQNDLRQIAVDDDLLLTAYSPLARGKVIDDPTLVEIGEQYGATAPQVALRWLIQQDHLAAIPKATSFDHIEANFAALDLELSTEDMRRIDALGGDERIIDPGFVDDWER